MKVLIIGGTRFIGTHVVRQLIEMGHEVTVFNRGQTTAKLPEKVKWIKGDRHNLSDYRSQFQQLAPQVVLDMIPYTAKDAQGVLDTFKEITQRIIAISSADVYRARDLIWQRETGIIDRTPLTENSPLRSQLYPYRGLSDDPFAHDYDKIPVEQVLMSDPASPSEVRPRGICNPQGNADLARECAMSASDLPATIIRLPMVYGAGDYQHRLYPYLKRMDDHRPAIVLEEKLASWQGCYGYVENVAYAIALAVNEERAKGRIYNVAELPGSTVADLIKAIARIVGWQGEIVIVPKTQMPDTWNFKKNLDQHWITDSSRLRTELGYQELVNRDEALRKTISWERKHPPEGFSEADNSKLLDYNTEDAILLTFK